MTYKCRYCEKLFKTSAAWNKHSAECAIEHGSQHRLDGLGIITIRRTKKK